GGSWLVRLGWLNLGLAAFNLLPALPLDGGRVFRSVLARSGDKLRATRIAAVVAGVFGVAIMAFGFVRDYFLVFIGAFVLMGANAEWQNARFGAALSGMKVGTVFHADATTVPAGVPAVQVAEWLSHFPGRAVPVVDEAGRYVGIVNQGDVTGALPEMTAGQAADRVAPVLTPDADLIPTAAEAFQSAHRKQLAVVADGRPVGVLYLQAVNAALTNAHQDRARVGRF
ncbi:MAG TPA: CBS domain-containing protein, partial [Mycobacteriales bacterium]|nr:CBS domain-containing protein [Mycobacteriales bacterium]